MSFATIIEAVSIGSGRTVHISPDEAQSMHVINPLSMCDKCTSRPCCDEEGVSPGSDSCHLIRRAEMGV